MKAFLSVQFCVAVCCLFFVPAGFTQANSRYAGQQAGADSWTTHNDPAGFVVDVPPAWTVAKDPATGRIVLRVSGFEIVKLPSVLTGNFG